MENVREIITFLEIKIKTDIQQGFTSDLDNLLKRYIELLRIYYCETD